jgi:hypothetical protein
MFGLFESGVWRAAFIAGKGWTKTQTLENVRISEVCFLRQVDEKTG